MWVLLGAVSFLIALGLVLCSQYIQSSRLYSVVLQKVFCNTKPPSPSLYPLGDVGTQFPQDVKPYQFPPLRERTSTKMAMGLKRLEASNWLTLDSSYLPEHALRLHLFQTKRAQVIQCLPGSEASCHELLSVVSSFLVNRFPQHFTVSRSSSSGIEAITNHLTHETYPLGNANTKPLETAAKLAMEDLNLLTRHPVTGEYHLQASATLFPAGWRLQERIGTSMANLHAPVPNWEEKLGRMVNRYFDHLSPKTSMERTNLFIQTTPDLFQEAPEAELLPELQARPESVRVEQIMVRRERQTFTKLAQTGAVVFTVRSFMVPLTSLGVQELRALRSQILGWEDEMRCYKGWDIWGESLKSWCDMRIDEDELRNEVNEKTNEDVKVQVEERESFREFGCVY